MTGECVTSLQYSKVKEVTTQDLVENENWLLRQGTPCRCSSLHQNVRDNCIIEPVFNSNIKKGTFFVNFARLDLFLECEQVDSPYSVGGLNGVKFDVERR